MFNVDKFRPKQNETRPINLYLKCDDLVKPNVRIANVIGRTSVGKFQSF